jgi:hypothetical protein
MCITPGIAAVLGTAHGQIVPDLTDRKPPLFLQARELRLCTIAIGCARKYGNNAGAYHQS